MSVLSLPRVHFFGKCEWNPNTVNNSPAIYNEATAEAIKQEGVPFEHFVDWLIEPAGTQPNGSWNVYGDHSVTFTNTTVVTCQPDSPQTDPLVGKSVAIFGDMRGETATPARLVDVDPYGSTTSQIFYTSIVVGDHNVGFTAQAACRMFSRWPSLRNLGQLQIAGPMGVIWHTAAKAGDIQWFGVDQSPALQALQAAANSSATGNQGIVMVFAAYRTLYFQMASFNGQRITNGTELCDAYKAGFTGGNPAESVIAGTIGVWEQNEIASAPVGRQLAAAAPVLPPTQRPPRLRVHQEFGLTAAAQQPTPVPLGPALVKIDCESNLVTLELIATFPEKDASLAKVDLGSFQLQSRAADGSTTSIGRALTPADYNQKAYEATAGIVDLQVSSAEIEAATNGTLELVQVGSSTVALAEEPITAETDQRGVYIDQTETQTITLNLYRQGEPATAAPIKVVVAQFTNQGNLITDEWALFVEVVDSNGNPVPQNGTVTSSNGVVTLQVKSKQPGTCFLGFFPWEGDTAPTVPPAGFPDSDSFYAVCRTLPFDNQFASLPPDQAVDWNFVYDNVLRNYNLVYPLMSTIINLGSESDVTQNKQGIAAAIQANFSSTLAMPITREMSSGKRTLLLKYLQQIGQKPSATSAGR